MAVTFAISTPSTTGGTTDASGSFTPAAGDLLVVFVVASGTTAVGSLTESLGEVTFTKRTSTLKNSSADTIYCFVANAPLKTAGARTVTVTTSSGCTGTVITVYRVSGQSKFGIAAIRQIAVQANQAASGTPAPAFGVAALTTNPVLGVVGNSTSPATMTPPATPTFTEDSDNGYSTPTIGQESVSIGSGFTGTTVTWGSTSATAFGDIIVEIDTSSITCDEEDGTSWAGEFLPEVIVDGLKTVALAATIFASALGLTVATSQQDDPVLQYGAYNSSVPQMFPTLRLASGRNLVSYAAGGNEDFPGTAPPANLQDEDFWQNPVAPVAASIYRSPVVLDPDEIPAGSLFGQADEDFWQNAVRPVAASIYRSPLFQDQDEIPAGSLFGQPEEDLWQNPTRPVPASLFQVLPYWFDAVEIVPQPAAPIPDEDFWQNGALPVQASLYRSPLFADLEEIPAGSLFGQYDEDFWRNWVAPVPASLYQRLPLGDPEEIPAGSLFGQYDEDFWRNWVAPVPASLVWPQPFSFDVQEPAGALHGQADEDFWQNPVRPLPASLYRSPVLGDQEEIPGALLNANPDEDYWQNRAAPIAASLYQVLPYLFDSVDFTPLIQPIQDEDFWQNPAWPIPASLYRSPLFSDPEELPAGKLVNAKPDEDYWQNWAAPVSASLYRSPVFTDPEEVPAGKLVNAKPDEDYWQNRVAPIAASLYQPLPYLYDPVDSGNLVAQAVTTLGGGVAWSPAGAQLSERHWSAPPSSTLPTKKGTQKAGSIAGTAAPAGLSAQATLGTVTVTGSGRAQVAGQTMRSTVGIVRVRVAATLGPINEAHRVKRNGVARLGRVKVRGIRNPSDEELLLILGEIE